MDLKPRFETTSKSLMVGIRRHHAFQDGATNLPKQWQEFSRKLPMPAQIGTTTYGIICGSDNIAKSFEYMTAVEVEEFPEITDWQQRLIIPIARYAVFTHDGSSDDIYKSWERIWQEWLPRSGYLNSNIPDFEKYDERFNPILNEGIVELWVPIKAK